MIISSAFDGGNIEVVDATDSSIVRLNICNDAHSDFYQWFYFRISDVRDTDLRLRIENAGGAAYAEGWRGYHAVASSDRKTWRRVRTEYDGQSLTIYHTPVQDSVWFAYFAPYSMERHHDLIARCASQIGVRHEVLGQTLDGQDLDLLSFGNSTPAHTVWAIARQHPGETMAEWWMEGFLDRLLDPDDPVATTLRETCRFHIVPNMNPDGSQRGHLRTNAAGVNLNREWNAPSMEKSPEVYVVRKRMQETGVDLHLDVHGDEAIPYNFIAGFEGIPSVAPALVARLERFKTNLAQLSPDFQTNEGYEIDAPNSSDLRKCTDWVAHEFSALAMTLEMPFKDNLDLPDVEFGWSPTRCRALGKSLVDAIRADLSA